MPACDVYLFGVVVTSTFHKIDDRAGADPWSFTFPEPNGYAEIRESVMTISGEAAGSALALARLGVKTKLGGNWLGACNGNVIPTLKQYGIDSSGLVIKEDFRGAEEMVFSDRQTRTVFGHYCRLLLTEPQWDTPPPSEFQGVRMVSLDPFFGHTSEAIAGMCQAAGVPYVTCDCTYDSLLCRQAAVVIISEEYLSRQLKRRDFAELFKLYQQACPGLVIMTFGSKPGLFARRGEPVRRFQPFRIDSVDTCGAGDSFRGGVIYGLLQQWPDSEVVRFASAVAALVCRSFPGCTGAPTKAEVDAFLRDRDA